jgi:group I intron endonuclease
MNTSGIYAITNHATNSMYIGSAVNIARRWRVHKHYLQKGTHPNKHLQNSYTKHSATVFSYEIIEFVGDKNNLISREQVWLDFFNPTYNKRKIANSCLGIKRSDEAKTKMSIAQTGKKQSEETKLKRSLALKGRSRPDYVKAKISASHIGIKPSEEAKAKMSLASKGKPKKKKDVV